MGKIASGRLRPVQTPAAQSTATSRRSAEGAVRGPSGAVLTELAATGAPSGRPTSPATMTGPARRRAAARRSRSVPSARRPGLHVDPVGAARRSTRPTRATPVTSSRRTAASGTTAASRCSPTMMRAVPKSPTARRAAAPRRSIADRRGEVRGVGRREGRRGRRPRPAPVRPASSTVAAWPGRMRGRSLCATSARNDEGSRVGDRQDLLVLGRRGRPGRRVREDDAVRRRAMSGARTRFFSASASARSASAFSAGVCASRCISRAPESAASLSRETIAPEDLAAARRGRRRRPRARRACPRTARGSSAARARRSCPGALTVSRTVVRATAATRTGIATPRPFGRARGRRRRRGRPRRRPRAGSRRAPRRAR